MGIAFELFNKEYNDKLSRYDPQLVCIQMQCWITGTLDKSEITHKRQVRILPIMDRL